MKRQKPSFERKQNYFSENHRVLFKEFVVDSFRYRVDTYKYYLLSHFHADHYGGISGKWCNGTIIGTPVTIALLKNKFKVDAKYLFELDVDTPTIFVGRNEDVYIITAIDAAHAPGSCCFVITRKSDGMSHLHVGDFRYDRSLQSNNGWKKYVTNINTLYLDTTYCNPQYIFEERHAVCNEAVEIVKKTKEKTIFIVGTYTIGKEVFAEHIAKKTGKKIQVDDLKMKLVTLCRRDLSLYTTDESDLRMMFMGKGFSQSNFNLLLSNYNGLYKRVIAFTPTGWAKKTTAQGSYEITNYSMPYSEHSSFRELVNCIKNVQPKQIIPTVFENGNSNTLVELLLQHTQPKKGTLMCFNFKVSTGKENSSSDNNGNSPESPLNLSDD